MIPASWPYSAQTYEAFTALKTAGFSAYCCGHRQAPHVLITAYDWGSYVDVVNIRGADRVTAVVSQDQDMRSVAVPAAVGAESGLLHGREGFVGLW